LSRGQQARYPDFPVADYEDFDFLKVGEQSFFDEDSWVLWEPSEDGQSYLGRLAPDDFDPEAQEAFAGPSAEEILHPEPLPSGFSEEVDGPAADQDPSGELAEAAVSGYALFDETTSEGSLILQNLPAPAEDKAYQLWFDDPKVDQPLNLGMLPALEEGAGRVFFELETSGFSPVGYRITEEPMDGSSLPQGRVVLEGP
ncbi:MAG: anti-sigma factor, partial [Verrucomicrobiota bacterium]